MRTRGLCGGGARRRIAALLLGVALLALLAGCGSGNSGGTNFNLGIAGSTLDHPADPPSIAQGGPGGAYAFVYDNQIWLRPAGQDKAKQLTHLALSNGATLRWGPLAWSHSGRFLAFSIVQDLNPSASTPPRSSGPIYYTDTQSCAENCRIFVTPATGSVYGHTYTWIGDSMLLYSGGSGLQIYTAGAKDPRVWLVREVPSGPSSSGTPVYYTFGDVAAASGSVYYTRLDIRTPGRVGVVGTAIVAKVYLGLSDTSPLPDPGALADRLKQVADSYAGTAAGLGSVYADPAGTYVAGGWQLASTRSGTIVAAERVDNVDTKAGTVTSRICVSRYGTGSCDSTILQQAGTHPWAVHAQLALAPDGKAAYATNNFYLDGGDKLGSAGWTTPPAWSPDGLGVAVTQLVGQTTGADGVTHYQTNVVYYKGGQGATLIAGAASLAFAPA